MKLNKSQDGDDSYTKATENTSLCSKPCDEKRQRRKSGRFLGLSLKPFSRESTKPETEEKTSLLKRFGSRRSSKKKNKGGKDNEKKTSSSSSTEGTDSTAVSTSDETDGPGHTPKTRRLQKVDTEKVYDVLRRSPCGHGGSDTEDETDNLRNRSAVLPPGGLKVTGRRLRRTMSMICGSGRSKLLTGGDSVVTQSNELVSHRDKQRCSFGAGILTRTQHKSGEEKENSGKVVPTVICNSAEAPSTDVSTPRNKDILCIPDDDEVVGSSRRRSLGGLNLSVRKNKPKRLSYDRMNRERDGVLSARKTGKTIVEEESSSLVRRSSLRRKWSSFKLTVSGQKCDEPQLDGMSHLSVSQTSARSTLRRKSLGGHMTPRDRRDRRGSGIYGSVATPTFMTCGFVMTDSPPNSSADLQEVYTKRGTNTAVMPIQPLDYNSEDLPWVAMKRKRRSELSDKAQVNRSHAGHTPVPPRKKRKSYDERLVE